jgi:hypothetical protein
MAVQSQAGQNSLQDPILKKSPSQKKKGWWSGSMCRPWVQIPVPQKPKNKTKKSPYLWGYNWYTEKQINWICTVWWFGAYVNIHDTTITSNVIDISSNSPRFFVSLYLSVLKFCFCAKNICPPDKFWSASYHICNYGLCVLQKISKTYSSCTPEIIYPLNTSLFSPTQPLTTTIVLSASEFDYYRNLI